MTLSGEAILNSNLKNIVDGYYVGDNIATALEIMSENSKYFIKERPKVEYFGQRIEIKNKEVIGDYLVEKLKYNNSEIISFKNSENGVEFLFEKYKNQNSFELIAVDILELRRKKLFGHDLFDEVERKRIYETSD